MVAWQPGTPFNERNCETGLFARNADASARCESHKCMDPLHTQVLDALLLFAAPLHVAQHIVQQTRSNAHLVVRLRAWL